jgi:dihydrolipoamide dehydrogenase
MAAYDVIIIGGGPGGYVAAQRLAERGAGVLLAEAGALGGTCLNCGCVPTKSLLHGAKTYQDARRAGPLGVRAGDVAYDWAAMQAWKDQTVHTLVGGVTALLQRLRVDVVHAPAEILASGVVSVGGVRHEAEDIIVAAGSVPVAPPIPGAAANPKVVDTTGLLAVDAPPARLTVIGSDAIGLEFASLFAALGTAVTVVETLPEILPSMDEDLAALLREAMDSITFKLGRRVDRIEGASVIVTDGAGEERIDADLVLMAVGRRPRFEGWGAEQAGLAVTSRGVSVDQYLRTNLPGVWAVGDVTGQTFLAHAAARMGEVVAALIADPSSAGRGQRMRWDSVPYTFYGLPEGAGVGLTERQAGQQGLDVVAATVPLILTGRFVAEAGLSQAGAVKLVAERDSRVIRGVHMFGPYAPEAMWGAAAAVEMELSIDELKQVIFPHPTVAEGIREACWAIRD